MKKEACRRKRGIEEQTSDNVKALEERYLRKIFKENEFEGVLHGEILKWERRDSEEQWRTLLGGKEIIRGVTQNSRSIS